MLVYHGTILKYAYNIISNGIDLSNSKQYLDFGIGFYTTDNYEMATNMAKRVAAYETKKININYAFPSIVHFEYTENKELKYKVFEKNDVEWARFIIANRVTPQTADRLGLVDNNYNHQYDIVIGGTADGSIAGKAAALRYGRLKPDEYQIELSDFLKRDGSSYGKQIAFCTEQSLGCIKYIKCDII